MGKVMLEIKNLTKYYGNILGVKDLSISLNEGEIFGFIGPNGAGKSTTIRAIMNLINKNEGKIIIDGIELTKDDIKLKEIIGYLPSEINLYDDLTVKEISQIIKIPEGTVKSRLSRAREKLYQILKSERREDNE